MAGYVESEILIESASSELILIPRAPDAYDDNPADDVKLAWRDG